jgi:HK97 family phage prohead protease
MTVLDELQAAPPAKLEVPVVRALDHQTELRAADPDTASPGTLVGEFSLFDQWYEINSYWEGRFLERIAPGAFKRTINNRSGETPVRCLLEHGYDPTVGDKPLGVPSILEERGTGCYAETPLFDTSYNRDLAPALAGGAYGQSFRFQVLRDEWVEEPEPSDHNPKGIPERTVTEVRLIEYGPTVFPA